MCCSSWTAVLDKRVRKRKSITANNKDAESSLPFKSTQWMGKYLSTAVLSFWMLQLSHAGYLIRSGTAASTQTSTPLAVRSPTTVTTVTILTLVFQWRQCVWRMVAGAMLRHLPDVSVSTFYFYDYYYYLFPNDSMTVKCATKESYHSAHLFSVCRVFHSLSVSHSLDTSWFILFHVLHQFMKTICAVETQRNGWIALAHSWLFFQQFTA